jgi:hypothetical protein
MQTAETEPYKQLCPARERADTFCYAASAQPGHTYTYTLRCVTEFWRAAGLSEGPMQGACITDNDVNLLRSSTRLSGN